MKIAPVYFHHVAITGFFGLFTLLMLWFTTLAPSQRFPVALMLLAFVVPLLLPMRGLLRRENKGCAWSAYLSLFYFMHGCIEAYANHEERWYAILEIIFSLMIFFGSALYIRFSGTVR